MKKVISPMLLLLALPMFAGGAFEIEGIMGMPSLFWAIALTLTAQILVLASGQMASPTRGRVSFIRAVAAILFFIGAFALPRAVFVVLYQKTRHVELIDSSQLTWALVESLVSIALLVYSIRAWHLFKARLQER